ncbi:hypothetical protein VC83_05494 [Pseudogymnoascus destructans]|uniref:Uncharacterized protein n=1 Tax=Pseudogymnoascus destructans TaxID=655981 RepID=A0A177A6P6_9PEZI|nr:uncharacterized protein VC83_05494 [Pseudogymnoascus destructans]OAF57838.1 hypothetical protein VC83_05494 [Pseudogymnoascus destructans]
MTVPSGSRFCNPKRVGTLRQDLAEELLDFYPRAKVVLNRRRDMNAWHRSLNEAAQMILRSWGVWGLSLGRGAVLVVSECGVVDGDCGFKKNGKEWARSYYERLEKKLERDGREYLDWEVQDGWGPLCGFLGKEVPEEDFPWGNRGGGEFEKNANKTIKKMA